MKREIPNSFIDKRCFFCGDENDQGLKLKFYEDKDTGEVYTEYLTDQPFFGQGNILHGGIQMGLLDEVMGWASHVSTGEMAVTSELKVTFVAPVYLGETIRVSCQVTAREGRRIHMQATIKNSGGKLCSSAGGTYYLMPRGKYEKLIYGR